MAKSTKSKYSAAESMLGYLYQCRCAFLLMLQRNSAEPSVQMSVERFDDVAFEENSSPREAIQTKHRLGTARSLTDRSVDLWKTLGIWCDGVRGGDFPLPGTVFSLITTQTAPPGSAAALLRPADDRDPAAASVLLLQAAGSTSNVEITESCLAFKKMAARKRAALVEAVYVHDAAPSILEIERHLHQAVHYAAPRDDHRVGFLDRLEGWWFRRLIRHLSASKNPPIRGEELDAEVERIQDGYRTDNLPIEKPLPDPPTPPDPANDPRAFVEQLRRVGLHNDRLRKAILDFYRAFVHRSAWVRESLLHLEELEDYDARLLDEWERILAVFQEALEGPPSDEKRRDLGRQLFNRIEEEAARFPVFFIRPRCTEPAISRGTFHKLADEGRVAWHLDEAAVFDADGVNPPS